MHRRVTVGGRYRWAAGHQLIRYVGMKVHTYNDYTTTLGVFELAATGNVDEWEGQKVDVRPG